MRWICRCVVSSLAVCALACSDPSAPPPEPGAVVVSPQNSTLTAIGDTVRYSAMVSDEAGNAMTGVPVTWSVQESSVATVDANGLVTARGAGTATVRATVTGAAVSGSAPLSVTQTVATLTIAGKPDSLLVGGMATLTATARDRNENAIANAPVTWSSTSTSVATVSNAGVVTAIASGTTTLRAVSGGVTAEASVVVRRPHVAFVRDTTLAGTVSVRDLTIAPNVTVRATNALTFDVEGRATVSGSVVADCRSISIHAGGTVRVTGPINNVCTDSTASAPGGVMIAATDTVVITGRILTDGALYITNDTSLTDSDFPALPPITDVIAASVSTYELRHVAGLIGSRRAPGECRVSGDQSRPERNTASEETGNARPGDAAVYRCNGKLVFDGVMLEGGRGQWGADHDHESATEAIAVGGHGGAGGPLRIESFGSIEFVGNNRIRPGLGGFGGRASARGLPGRNDPLKAASAHATGGRGGPEGPISMVASGGNITGFYMMDFPPGGGRGGDALAEGGNGVDADANFAAQEGGNATAIAGAGGSGTVPGEGGVAYAWGGPGGDGSEASPNGANGGKVSVTGGAGGRSRPFTIAGASGPATGGVGGDAYAQRGTGGDGYGTCEPAFPAGGTGGRGGPVTGRGGAGGIGVEEDGEPGVVRLKDVANGGRGGDGTAPGAGGNAGEDAATGARTVEEPAFKPGTPGTACGPVLGASVSVPSISGTHIIGSSPCPQNFGSVTLTNTGTVAFNFSLSPPFGISISPTSGSLQPGQSVVINVNFNCQNAQSFSSQLFFIINGANGSGNTNRSVMINATVQ